MWVHFWVFNPIPLIRLPDIVPIPCSFYHYCSVVSAQLILSLMLKLKKFAPKTMGEPMLILQWFIQHLPNAFGILFLLVLMCCYCLVITFTDMETPVGPIVSSFIVMNNYLTMKYPHCLKVGCRFVLLMVSFALQKLRNFMRSHLSILDLRA